MNIIRYALKILLKSRRKSSLIRTKFICINLVRSHQNKYEKAFILSEMTKTRGKPNES